MAEQDSPRTSRPQAGGHALLRRLVAAEQPPAFALLHRPRSTGGDVEVLIGDVGRFSCLADLPLSEPNDLGAGPGHELLALVPFRQITERGYDCRDDNEPILALSVTEQATLPFAAACSLLPRRRLQLLDPGFDVDDEAYARLVQTIISDEIGQGSGSNFVVQRAFTATIEDYSATAALALFRNLLAGEMGAYWTFVVHTGTRTFVGATPERHLSLEGDAVVMNPISGTLRYPPSGLTVSDVLGFLDDTKETDELQMVVDEELKMMAAVCHEGGRIIGPYLKEMARVAHTEYLIQGRTTLDVRVLLRETMFAPTVTGSPLENAFRVLARHELTPRAYYSGIIAAIGRDDLGRRTLDSSILIRTADIDEAGRLALRVGATVVRHSDPASEVLETHAKAAGLLSAAGAAAVTTRQHSPAATAVTGLPAVQAALARRNDGLARFWLDQSWSRTLRDPRLVGRRILVVDAEDTFTAMLGHQLRALGLQVQITPHDRLSFDPVASPFDIVLIGPGPGDPQEISDPRIRALRELTEGLLRARTPFVSVCLGHQVLAATLGLPVVRKARPSQGLQREIDLFGRTERVGFYNTFTATSAGALVASDRTDGPVEVSRDEATGEVHGLRGTGFAAVQFHPESVLTVDGPRIISNLISWSLDSRPAATAGLARR
jgi:phenazine biosynthesis protein phzE